VTHVYAIKKGSPPRLVAAEIRIPPEHRMPAANDDARPTEPPVRTPPKLVPVK
jgi:hypothetical protein